MGPCEGRRTSLCGGGRRVNGRKVEAPMGAGTSKTVAAYPPFKRSCSAHAARNYTVLALTFALRRESWPTLTRADDGRELEDNEDLSLLGPSPGYINSVLCVACSGNRRWTPATTLVGLPLGLTLQVFNEAKGSLGLRSTHDVSCSGCGAAACLANASCFVVQGPDPEGVGLDIPPPLVGPLPI